MENIYIPPLTRKVTPPIEHRRTSPNYTQISDVERKRFFTNFNETLIAIIRQIKNQ